MSKHTPASRGERGGAGAAGRSLQPDLAFVVQLRAGSGTSLRSLRGRVEHVVSGEALRFDSTDELIEFLARCGRGMHADELPREPDA